MTRTQTHTLALAATATLLASCAGYQPYRGPDAPGGAYANDMISDNIAYASGMRDNPDAVRCKEQPVTGSRFTKEVCFTNREWERLAQQAVDDTNRMQEMGRIGRAR